MTPPSPHPNQIAESIYRPGDWKCTATGRRPTFTHTSGAQVRKGVGDLWYAYRPDGTPLRVVNNCDGTPYVPRPWHEPRDMPPVWRFKTKKSACLHLLREAASKARDKGERS